MSSAGRPLAPAHGTGGLSDRVLHRIAEAIGPAESVCVAYSGGIDSTVLLHIAARGRSAISAVHVHHGLSPHADAWAQHCVATCAALGVDLEVVRVAVARDAGRGIEAAAREARHAVFAARRACVLLAHHRDDQAETVLLQLARGTGLRGAAAMPRRRALGETALLVRPMLDESREAIAAFARENGLAWIEDDSNAAPRFDRNYLRLEVAPLLDARFPGWRHNVARFASLAAQGQELLDALADIDGVPAKAGEPLPLRAGLAPERRANALRTFLARNGLPMPDAARLAEIARQAFDARADARVRITIAGHVLHRHRGHLCIDRARDAAQAWRVDWHREARLDLGDVRGIVRFVPETGAGVAAGMVDEGEWYFAPRAGGERLRLGREGRSRTLKNLLQESGVAPWRREALPLLFRGEDLVWVPGIGIAAGYACGRGAQGLRPCLEGFGGSTAVLE